MDSSPYAQVAHEATLSRGGDALARAAAAPELVAVLVNLPPLLLYDLALGPVVRIAASERRPVPAEIAEIIESCWRAVTR